MKKSTPKAIENIAVPEFANNNHKLWLKKALKSATQKQSPTFSFIQKLGTAILIPLFIIGIFFGYNNFSPSPSAQAQSIVSQVILQIEEEIRLNNNLTAELQLTLNILKEALDAKDLEYIGDEIQDDQTIRKLQFTDEDIGRQMLIYINPDLKFAESYEKYYPHNVVGFELGSQYDQMVITKNLEVTLEHKAIPNVLNIQAELKDTQLKNALAKMLIQKANSKVIFNIQEREEDYPICEEGMGETWEGKNTQDHVTDEELEELIIPLIKNSEVLIGGLLCQRNSEGKIKSFTLIYSKLGDFSEKKRQSYEFLEQLIQKISTSSSDETQAKLKILEKAQAAEDLLYLGDFYKTNYDEKFKLIEYENQEKNAENIKKIAELSQKTYQWEVNWLTSTFEDLHIDIYHDPKLKGVNSIFFEFRPKDPNIWNKTLSIKGTLENGKITNIQDIQKQLTDNTVSGKYLSAVLEYENKRELQWMYDWENDLHPQYQSIGPLARLLKPVLEASTKVIYHIEWKEIQPGKNEPHNIKSFKIDVFSLPKSLFE